MFLNGGIGSDGTGPFRADFFGDDIHHAAQRIRTVEGRHWAAHHFDTFDGVNRDPVQVEVVVAENGVSRVNAFTVDENQGVAAVQAANADALTVIPLVGELDARHFFQHIFQVLHRLALQVFLGNDADARGGILYALFGSRRRHDQHFIIICGRCGQRQGHYGRAQSAPNDGV